MKEWNFQFWKKKAEPIIEAEPCPNDLNIPQVVFELIENFNQATFNGEVLPQLQLAELYNSALVQMRLLRAHADKRLKSQNKKITKNIIFEAVNNTVPIESSPNESRIYTYSDWPQNSSRNKPRSINITHPHYLHEFWREDSWTNPIEPSFEGTVRLCYYENSKTAMPPRLMKRHRLFKMDYSSEERANQVAPRDVIVLEINNETEHKEILLMKQTNSTDVKFAVVVRLGV